MASNGHIDVAVPAALQPRIGSLLAAFEAALLADGHRPWRQEKEEGGHVTPWWLYLSLSEEAGDTSSSNSSKVSSSISITSIGSNNNNKHDNAVVIIEYIPTTGHSEEPHAVRGD